MFLDRTLDDLEIEFWVDYYEKNPLEAHRNENGEIQFHTDDDLLNKWEEQIAKGETPDLEQAFDPRALEKLRSRAKRKQATGGMSFKDVAERIDREQSAVERRIAKNKHLQPKITAPTFGLGLEE